MILYLVGAHTTTHTIHVPDLMECIVLIGGTVGAHEYQLVMNVCHVTRVGWADPRCSSQRMNRHGVRDNSDEGFTGSKDQDSQRGPLV